MQLEKLNDTELRVFIRDFLRLPDVELRMSYSLDKSDVEKILSNNESFAERFDELVEEVFEQKLRRDCSVTISMLMEDLKADTSMDVNDKRVTQQTLQTLIMIKKGFSVKKNSSDSSFASIMEELNE